MKNRKVTKALALLLALLMAMSLFTACGKEEVAEEATEELTGEEAVYAALDKTDWPKSVTLIAGPQGGPWYPIMVLLCEICNEYLPEVSWNVIDGGSLGNIRVVNEGEDAQIGFTYYALLAKALDGTLSATAGETFDNVEYGNACNSSTTQITVLADSGFTSISQAVDKRLDIGQLTSGHTYMIEDLLKYYGCTDGYDSVVANGGSVQFTNYTEMSTLMTDKHLDFTGWCGNVPHSSAMEVDASVSLDCISFTDEELEYLHGLYPAMEVVTIPAGTFSGQKNDAQTFTLPTTFIYNKDLPDSLVYAFTYCTMMHSDLVREAYAGDSYTKYFNLDDTVKFVTEDECEPNVWKAVMDAREASK